MPNIYVKFTDDRVSEYFVSNSNMFYEDFIKAPNGIDINNITKYNSKWELVEPTDVVESIPESLPTFQTTLAEELADPITGSDHLFIRALRKQLSNNDDWVIALDEAKKRYEEIKKQFPKPK